MALSEATLRKGFVEELKRREHLEVTRIEDTISSGIPDICVSGIHMWIETKVAKDGRVKSKGIQRLTLRRLGRVSPAYMLIWDCDARIVHLVPSGRVPLSGTIKTPALAITAFYQGDGAGFPHHQSIVDYLIARHA